ncbi:DUF3099 domain-containing protein [Embleya sp. NBC_00896]|uniref:DUF3099 domain-containing protein n=1 Tax=Embleya sp. NBC_00896 TaxID=2975961 RepID=UPI003869141B|nr:DUF3099 domain-containing protein [Embleya sp. NBC_00896]
MKNAKSAVYQISGARKGLTEDVAGRQRRYVISMSIRTVCFIGAVFTPSPWRWILVAGALFLPYIAVVVANAGREPTSNAPVQAQIVPPLPPKALEPPPGAVLTSAERETLHAHSEDSWTMPSTPTSATPPASPTATSSASPTTPSSATRANPTDLSSHTNSDTHGDAGGADRGHTEDPTAAPSHTVKN